MTGPVETVQDGIVLVSEGGKFLQFFHSGGFVEHIKCQEVESLGQATVNPGWQEMRVIGNGTTRLHVRVTRRVELLPEPLDFNLQP